MQKKPSVYRMGAACLLPFLLTACGGSRQENSHTVPEIQATAGTNPTAISASDSRENDTKASVSDKNANREAVKQEDNKSTVAIASNPNRNSDKTTSLSSGSSTSTNIVKPKENTTPDTEIQKPQTDVLAKTPVTPELIEKVKLAKDAVDSTGLPIDYQADYVVITPSGKTEVHLKAPEGAKDNYYFNSTIFPQGESLGTMQSQLDGKPHTAEEFMSYQQFYSGITGTRKKVVYFDNEAIQRDEPFYIELPTGLVSKETDLPIAGEAHYQGKAIDGQRFGDFSYHVNFKEKMGTGGSIVWDKTKPGSIGDIVLQPGKIATQALSVAIDPDLFPDEYSHRGPGIAGVAVIDGEQDKKFEYKGVFFGPKAEEFSGLIYEHNEAATNSIFDEIEQNNIVSFAGER